MNLEKASKLFKTKFIRTLNIKIENVGRTLSSYNNSNKTDTYLILHRLNYKTNGIWQHDYTRTLTKQFYSKESEDKLVDSNIFEIVCDDTLNSLADYFEDLIENDSKFEKADVMYGAGVLTVDLGNHGTYVINRQSPNRQIWLSSPTSGPKRFDYLTEKDCWIYKHDGQTLHSLLKREFQTIIGKELTFLNCSHCNLIDS